MYYCCNTLLAIRPLLFLQNTYSSRVVLVGAAININMILLCRLMKVPIECRHDMNGDLLPHCAGANVSININSVMFRLCFDVSTRPHAINHGGQHHGFIFSWECRSEPPREASRAQRSHFGTIISPPPCIATTIPAPCQYQ